MFNGLRKIFYNFDMFTLFFIMKQCKENDVKEFELNNKSNRLKIVYK
jgi:hypothetical protein